MTTINVSLPNVLHIDLKGFPQQTVGTEKFDAETINNMVKFAIRVHLERKKNAGGEERSDADRREAVEKARKEIEAGKFELKIGAAAKLDLKEEEFRKLLAEQFEKKGGCKKTDAATHARVANRAELFRDLVVKRQLAELGVSVTSEELQSKSEAILRQLDIKAENNAITIQNLRSDMEISFA